MPFCRVVSYSDSRGRGVVGILKANFVKPTHNKQDFEKTYVFQKLEGRLKEMTFEYWDYHCRFIGYQVKKKPRAPMFSQGSSAFARTMPAPIGKSFHPPPAAASNSLPGRPGQSTLNFHRNSQEGGAYLKRKEYDYLE